MIFVIAAIFILIISFVVALVSLIREQSKIEKESVAPVKSEGQPEVETPKADDHLLQPDSPKIETLKPQLSPHPEPQTPVPTPQHNAVPLKQKPWWETEIQGSGEEQQTAVDWQNMRHGQHQARDVPQPEELAQDLVPESRVGTQTPQEKEPTLQGSFSLSDLKRGDQES